MDANDYSYSVIWSDEDNEYVGLCAEFPGLSWLEPDHDAALAGIRNVVKDCVEDMLGNNETIPQPQGG